MLKLALTTCISIASKWWDYDMAAGRPAVLGFCTRGKDLPLKRFSAAITQFHLELTFLLIPRIRGIPNPNYNFIYLTIFLTT